MKIAGPIQFRTACCREDKYAITDEELRPYFALPNVLEGLFGLAKRLFDVDIEAADGQVTADIIFVVSCPGPYSMCTGGYHLNTNELWAAVCHLQ